VIPNIKEADILPSSWTSQLTSLEKLSRFVWNGDIAGKFSFCRSLPQATKGQNILDVDSYLSFYDFSWRSCTASAWTLLPLCREA
jgi:hypothetical protein